MKKLKTIFILLASLLLFNCNNGTSPEVPDNKPIEPETFSTTKVFNPTNNKVKLLAESVNRSAESTDVICELDPKEAKDIETHMFHHVLVKKVLPFVNYKEKAKIKDNCPKSKEAAIICLSDLLVSVYEFEKYRLRYGISLTFVFLLNLLTLN